MADETRFRFVILGRYRTQGKGAEPQLTVNVTSGEGDHFTYSGTLTLTDREWEDFARALRSSLGDRVEIEEAAPVGPEAIV